MPYNDSNGPQSDSFYAKALEQSMAESRASRPLAQSLIQSAQSGVTVLGAIGDGKSFALPTPEEQPPTQPQQQQSAVIQPFTIIVMSSSTVRVTSSAICNLLPPGFSAGDTPIFTLDVAPGDIIYGSVTFDVSDGTVGDATSATVTNGSSVPDDDHAGATFYYRIGSVSTSDGGGLVAANDAYGPLQNSPCRNWFSVDGISFNPNWSASFIS